MSEPRAYDRIFWLAYLANGLVTVANAMLVRYADFVSVLGGGEGQLGLIVGCGTIGGIAMRLVQGECIDRYGSGRIWLWSIAIYSLALSANLMLQSAFGPTIFLTRIAMQTSVAGVFGSSITFVSARVPPHRMAEVIGTLGTSGFIGMMLGPLWGDWICASTVTRVQIDRLFLSASGTALIGTLVTWLATRTEIRPRPRRRPRVLTLVRRYSPWCLALVAAAMGAGLSIPTSFLRPFARDLNIEHIGVFFTVYSLVAFAARIATREMFDRYGNHVWIVVGMVLLSVSFLLYLPSRTSWHLIAPGAIAGMAHAFLFPSVMAAGTSAFPRRYLGVATSLMLAMFDFGTFVAAPIFGRALQNLKANSSQIASAYNTMFCGTFLSLASVTAAYYISNRPRNEPSVANSNSPPSTL